MTKIKNPEQYLIYLDVTCPECYNIWKCPVDIREYEIEGFQGIDETGVYPTEIVCPTCVANENEGVQLDLLFA